MYLVHLSATYTIFIQIHFAGGFTLVLKNDIFGPRADLLQ
jgi:hypothetical protein